MMSRHAHEAVAHAEGWREAVTSTPVSDWHNIANLRI
jgi:hypothetical protein